VEFMINVGYRDLTRVYQMENSKIISFVYTPAGLGLLFSHIF
jgi:hypothetical protein